MFNSFYRDLIIHRCLEDIKRIVLRLKAEVDCCIMFIIIELNLVNEWQDWENMFFWWFILLFLYLLTIFSHNVTHLNGVSVLLFLLLIWLILFWTEGELKGLTI